MIKRWKARREEKRILKLRAELVNLLGIPLPIDVDFSVIQAGSITGTTIHAGDWKDDHA